MMDDARWKALQTLFGAMEQSLRKTDEAAFQACWTPDGYATNLVGGSGLAGQEVFVQGSQKKWFLKPELGQAIVVAGGSALIVPCQVWAWEKQRAVDKVDLLLLREKDAYRVHGGGEKRAEVEALADRTRN
jgi:hypothetical protein